MIARLLILISLLFFSACAESGIKLSRQEKIEQAASCLSQMDSPKFRKALEEYFDKTDNKAFAVNYATRKWGSAWGYKWIDDAKSRAVSEAGGKGDILFVNYSLQDCKFHPGTASYTPTTKTEVPQPIAPQTVTPQAIPPKQEPLVNTTFKEEKKRTEVSKVVVRGEKVKVGVIEFQNLNEEAKRENLGTIFSEMLTTSFVNSEAFKITEREQLQKVAKELELSQTGIVDVTQAKEVGKMVGADAIVTGSVIKIGGDLRLDARIIDVQSGIILNAEKIIGKSDLRGISDMADGIVDTLVNKFYREK